MPVQNTGTTQQGAMAARTILTYGAAGAKNTLQRGLPMPDPKSTATITTAAAATDTATSTALLDRIAFPASLESEPLARTIAVALAIKLTQALRTLELLDGGNTVPFIARYRKEVTGHLDEV